jgi:hypothetical protein
MTTDRPWSLTLSTESRGDYEALVVCCLPLGDLGIESLVEEVTDLYGREEGQRWCRARAEEYARCLLNALRMHMPAAELIVHVEASDDPQKIRVVIPGGDADVVGREAELTDRVVAIRRRTRTSWLEGLQTTMASLRRLEEVADAGSPASAAPS